MTYRCPHGLVDNAMPILINGKHLANFFTGQFFLEPPDLDFFRGQAKKYGFDERTYLEAVRKAPVWSVEKLDLYLNVIKTFVDILVGIGLKNLQEIEARRLLEEKDSEIRRNELLLSSITEGTTDAVYLKDLAGHYLLANSATLRFLDKAPSEVIGKNDAALFSPQDANFLMTEDRKTIESGAVRTYEETLTTTNGLVRTFLTTKGPVRDPEGRPTGLFGIARDITERIQNEKRIKSMAHVHELLYRTKDFARVDLHDYVDRLLKNVLSVSELQSQSIKTRIEITNIRIDLNIAVPLGLIINELITNAVKHAFTSEKTGELLIRITQDDCRYTLIVQDNGTGFPEGLDPRHSQTLGLRLISALTQQLGGHFQLCAERGTRAEVTFEVKRS